MSTARFLFAKIAQVLAAKGLYLSKSLNYKTSPAPLPINLDYVRYATLGLCYQELAARQVPGNVAELGVYQGDFAKRLNHLFADRKLYLFDTFEGFDRQDVATEQASGFSTGAQSFANTSVELVLGKMPHPEQCIVKKGFFPATAADVADTFCFVSLDADPTTPFWKGYGFFTRACRRAATFSCTTSTTMSTRVPGGRLPSFAAPRASPTCLCPIAAARPC